MSRSIAPALWVARLRYQQIDPPLDEDVRALVEHGALVRLDTLGDTPVDRAAVARLRRQVAARTRRRAGRRP